MMTHRDREIAAILHKPVDRVPMDAICVENGDAILGEGASYEDVLRHLDIDGRCVHTPYSGPLSGGIDEWGTSAQVDYGTTHAYPLADADSIADIEAHPLPNLDLYDYAGAAQAMRDLRGEYATRGPYWFPLFCRLNSLFGMEECLCRMLTDPALFEAALDRVFEATYAYCERYLERCGDHLDIFYLGDDFASQRGMIFDPALWRRYFKPRYKRLFDLGRKHGKLTWFHSCGDVTAILPDFIDIGIQVWETVQLHTLPMTPEQLKREFGRDICFFGGISTQSLPGMTPQQVREQVKRCVAILGEGSGYILGPDHHIGRDVSAENTLAIFGK